MGTLAGVRRQEREANFLSSSSADSKSEWSYDPLPHTVCGVHRDIFRYF